MKQAMINLLKVKTLLSLIVMCVASYMAIKGTIDPATYMVLASAIVTYYFNKKENKESDSNE